MINRIKIECWHVQRSIGKYVREREKERKGEKRVCWQRQSSPAKRTIDLLVRGWETRAQPSTTTMHLHPHSPRLCTLMHLHSSLHLINTAWKIQSLLSSLLNYRLCLTNILSHDFVFFLYEFLPRFPKTIYNLSFASRRHIKFSNNFTSNHI